MLAWYNILHYLYIIINHLKKHKMTTLNNLTSAELKTYKVLVMLGDSKELALSTVVSERENEVKKAEANEFYRNAYTN